MFRTKDNLQSHSIPPQRVLVVILSAILASLIFLAHNHRLSPASSVQRVPLNAQKILDQCAAMKAVPGPPESFLAREQSDRFEPGTNATLIRNATIFTGARNGTETILGDLLLDKGIVKAIGDIPDFWRGKASNLTIVEANHAWVTPGLVDLHSHVGLVSAPLLRGASDVNSPNGPILPWLRSIDAFNTHDDAFQLAIAGGVTSVQILPGSGNAIGGQAFIVKLRKTAERSPSSMVVEPPHGLNGTSFDPSQPLRWRHLKQACGENLRGYGARMDSIWSFRSAYNEARKIKLAQDAYCTKAEAGLWESLEGELPDSFKWEMLVDVLHGRVKISNHCYEAVDLDDIVRLTNEFEFPLASFHHASEAWLVPEVLKRTWGGTPAIAVFATNHRYKRESYRGSEFAPRVLADNGIPVVMKSDHPVINSRYLLYEAQQAHYFGLPPHLALASVSSVPAKVAGLSHRIGILQVGADADVVVWDSHPLQIGATPVKVWIDGILQIPVPLKSNEEGGDVAIGKGKEDPEWQEVPDVPDWDKERKKAIEWEGLPPLQCRQETNKMAFTNVREMWTRGSDGILENALGSFGANQMGNVIIEHGEVICAGSAADCLTAADGEFIHTVDLRGGSIAPGLMSFGSPLGLEEIAGEPSTGNGVLYDPFSKDVPRILGDVSGISRAVDALQFQTRNAMTAYRSGVTSATSSLATMSLWGDRAPVISGLSTTFRTGSAHALETGAIIKNVTALHVSVPVRPNPLHWGVESIGPSTSEQIAGLRRLLSYQEPQNTETGYWFKQASYGLIPLVIDVHNADVMATLLNVKKEVEERRGTAMKMVFAGATEAHLLADEISKARVGVILKPARPYPASWDSRRILAGPPLTNDTALTMLLEHGVTVGIGVSEAWEARNVRFDIAWAALESGGRLGKREAYTLASTNLEQLLGVDIRKWEDLVAYEGGDAFDLASKVVAVISPERGAVDLV